MVGGIIAVAVLLFIGGFIFLQPRDERLACSSAADCVPAGCCHSDSAVNKNFSPNCADIVCSAVCEPNTMDCGQAKPICKFGKCSVEVIEREQKRGSAS